MNTLLFTRYKLHHVLLWGFYFLFWVLVYKDYYPSLPPLLLVTSMYLVSHVIIYYGTQYKLIPLVLKKGNILLFVFAFLFMAVALALMLYIGFYWMFKKELDQVFQGNSWAFLLPLFMSNVFIGGLLIGAKSVVDRVRQQRQSDRKKQESLASELNYLKAQVNPHFLFNAINSVYVLIKIDPDKAAATLIKLSDLLRSQIYDFSADVITIEQEISYLENYIELEKIRRGHRVHVEFEKEGALTGFTIPPLLFIPFLENCFKHLSSYSEKDNRVEVKISRKGGRLEAQFSNTFESGKSDNQHEGIGLNNVKRRLELLFPQKHDLEISKSQDMFQVFLRLEIEDE